MADEADKSASGVLNTPGDEAKDGKSPEANASKRDKAPGSFGDEPKRRGRPPGSKNRPKPLDPTGVQDKTRAWLVKRLSSLLRSPGFAFEMTGDPWAAKHIDEQGPNLAKALADHAERNPVFKARLVAFLEGGETAGLLFAAIMYVAPLAIYFGIVPIPDHLRARLPIPQRGGMVTAGVSMPQDGPTQESLEAEAKAKGFEDLGDYMNAVQTAIANVQGPGVTASPFETMP